MTIGAAVIGIGFMGRTHIAAYQAAGAAGHPCTLVAVCDRNQDRLAGRAEGGGNLQTGAGEGLIFDPARVKGYMEVDELLADSRVHLVSVCTYTDTHVGLVTRALAAGKHVVVEKPVALHSPEVQKLIGARDAAGRVCMPAMCMRFWPGWTWLKDRVSDGTLGRVRSATFSRVGAGPGWGAEFYRDLSRSGGALFDLHTHDTDVVQWLFGKPAAVSSAGTLEHLSTLYRFAGGPTHVTAEGGWSFSATAGFRMRFTVCFEKGTADFDLNRTPQLLWHGERTEGIDLPTVGAYDAELRHVVDVIGGRASGLRVSLEDVLVTTQILEAERRSFESGRTVDL